MPPAFKVNFDTADIYWLRAYSRLISSMAQFLLAHDFEKSFNASALLFFPGAGDGTAELLEKNRSLQPYVSGEIGDFIAMLHLANWPVIDEAKREDVRQRLLAVTELAPKTWAAARKETDDDLEWLPNPKQKQGITGTQLTDIEIDGWLGVMAELNAILDGKKLMPHWRFDKGVNVKRWFAEEKTYDLVLLRGRHQRRALSGRRPGVRPGHMERADERVQWRLHGLRGVVQLSETVMVFIRPDAVERAAPNPRSE